MQGEVDSARGISNEALTELALNSAIALDRRLLQQGADDAVVTEFLDVLGRIVDVSTDQTAGKLVSDPRKVGVVNRAFRHLNQDKVPTVQDLIEKIKILSDGYNERTTSADAIRSLRNFCIALHKELLAHTYRSYDHERKREGAVQNAAGLF